MSPLVVASYCSITQGASPNSRLLEGSSERPLFQTSRDSEFTDLWTPALSFAAREGHVEIVRELLAHKDIDVNASDFQMETALHSVMVPFMNERHLEVVRMLLAMGKKLTCETCGKVFWTTGQFNAHTRKHNNTDTFIW